MREKPTHTTGRATTIAELDIVLSNYFGSILPQFTPRPTDIIISPYAKSGTTWLQQITHGLRTRGNMDFDKIYTVIPWIDIADDMGWDLEADQPAEPRLFKSHRSYEMIEKGGRYICAFRHPHDCMISLYRFFEGWYFEPGTIDLDTLTRWRWPRDQADTQGYWYHLRTWWEQRHNPDVLLLCYENMKADLPRAIQQIAHFMKISLDDELLDIVTRQSSRKFMLAHKHRFDEQANHAVLGKRAGLPDPIEASKVTAGTPNDTRYQLSPTLKQELDEIWQEQIETKLGFKNYQELRQAVTKLNSDS